MTARDSVLRAYTIYRENPNVFSVREFEIRPGSEPIPGNVLGIRASLDQARELIPWSATYCSPAEDGDDPSIVETWI